ncbi:MAG: response regulator transcription factor [Lachnospiraceae bacterium]|nr:response regulator transcription factor [Lachnospiraceae bacterium]
MTAQKTILIIEDDTEISNMLRILLTQNGYHTLCAYSGTEGLLVHNEGIHLILLDLMLPGKNGEEIIGELKKKHPAPVIVMSAIHEIGKKVDLFSLGANDYITKPFHNEELLARIAARLRDAATGYQKMDSSTPEKLLTYQDITLDPAAFCVTCAKKPVSLSKYEFALLRLLMENPNRTCTKSKIYDYVWNDENSADDNTLNVHISKLRKKLKECNPKQDYIETVWGVGYRLQKLPH